MSSPAKNFHASKELEQAQTSHDRHEACRYVSDVLIRSMDK